MLPPCTSSNKCVGFIHGYIQTLSTAKEERDHLESLFTGNASIKSSNFDEINSEQENFIMNAGETSEDMHGWLTTLSVATRLWMQGCG
jgi:hypothetical protein